ncbi:MAG: 2-hydroxy-3-oxopropionate reductase [Bacteroidetes bacterium]|nr:2-hydroxy-3-oxopropionate reductase [Bacteroidota bacterium]
MPDKPKIGFIGLGIMGKPMARNLKNAGYSVVVYDIFPAPVEELKKEGFEAAASNKEIAQRSDVVITMVPDSADSEAAILGPSGVLEGSRKGTIVIDMSSINPLMSRKIGAELEKHGVEFLDAPVSGGEPGAIAGSLAIMVGGKQALFDRMKPILDVVGGSVTLVGEVGAGNVTKLANQIMVAANIEAMGEALVLAAKAGVDPELVFNAVKGGLAGSAVLNAKAPMVINRNFKAGFRIRLHQKDLHNSLMTAKELGVSLPVTALIQQMLTSLMADGKGNDDHSAIVTFIENISKTEVKRPG